MSTAKFYPIRRNLLRWYDQTQRDLPWRHTCDPYKIWIAETMLQQTQVKTVLPYYHRFIKAFPTIEALDRASKEEVLALWSGLGYYRRAENLKKAARKIVRDHDEQIPREFNALCALPGVGPYTAGALMSIAFNQAYPALDGNARRVLVRLFAPKREKDLREVGRELVSPSRPGDFNQALMELGATTCLAKDPRCPTCPVARLCAAKKSGHFDLMRLSLGMKEINNIDWPLALIEKNRKILLRRRPPGGILGGLWELPGGERKKGESVRAALARHLNGLAEQMGPHSQIGEFRHSITYRRIRVPLFAFVRSNSNKIRLPHSSWRWFLPSSLERYPLSSLSLKAVRYFTQR